jgi:hypothetical protein
MRPLVAFAAFLVSTATASAQTEAWADKLFGGELVHDFGAVPRGAQLKHSFKFTNPYKVPLEITDIRVTCDCLSAKSTVKTLQPQESANLDITMDGRRFNGVKTIKIFVSVGPQYVSTATLTVSANARQDVVFNPGEIDFGLVGRGQKLTKHIDVEYAGNKDWRVNEIVKNGNAPFDLKVEELPVNFRGRGYRLFATLKADAEPGAFKQEIILKTNDPETPVLTFHVLGNVQGDGLAVNPKEVKLGAVKVGDSKTSKIFLRGSQEFQVTSIGGLGSGVTAAIPSSTSKVHFIEVRFTPNQAGAVHQELVIRTNQNETVKVVIEGEATP